MADSKVSNIGMRSANNIINMWCGSSVYSLRECSQGATCWVQSFQWQTHLSSAACWKHANTGYCVHAMVRGEGVTIPHRVEATPTLVLLPRFAILSCFT